MNSDITSFQLGRQKNIRFQSKQKNIQIFVQSIHPYDFIIVYSDRLMKNNLKY